MKNYFNYGANLSSKEASEAIAMVHGSGPIIGFGSADIDVTNNVITLNPLPSQDDPMYRTMVGRQKQWNITKASGDSEPDQTKFAAIAKDGCIFADGSNTIEVNIQGSKSNYNEVIVFALHTPIDEPISNPVTFLAFWSEGVLPSDSFYSMYQKSLDPYYPLAISDRTYDFANNSGINNDLNYDALETKVASCCTYYANNRNSLVLIGIYGTGNNPITEATGESFALVPYNGEFPDHVSYTPAIHRSLRLSLKRLEAIIGTNTSGSEVGITTIADLLSGLKDEIIEEVSNRISLVAMPVGSIILWEGDTIPNGWAEYTNAAGRVVVGYQSGGIPVPNTTDGTTRSNILTSVGSTYTPLDGDYSFEINATNLPYHTHGLGITKGGQEDSSDDDKSVVQSWSNRDTSLTGNVGDRGPTFNVSRGGISTSRNFIVEDGQSESHHARLNAIKLPKAIALRYIIKLANS